AAANRDGHGRVARSGRRDGRWVEAYAYSRRHTRSRETNGAVESAADGGGDGRGALVALRDSERSRRGRDSEVRLSLRGNGQHDYDALLDPSSAADHGDRVGQQLRVTRYLNGHNRDARARRLNELGIKAHGYARGHCGSGETDEAVESTADRSSDRRRSLAPLRDSERGW